MTTRQDKMRKKATPEVSAEELQKRFGNNLRRTRNRAGLSQRVAAELTGTNPGYLSQVELGNKNVTLESMVHFADAFRVSVASLLIEDKDIITLVLNHIASMLHDELSARLKTTAAEPPTPAILEHALQDVFSRLKNASRKIL